MENVVYKAIADAFNLDYKNINELISEMSNIPSLDLNDFLSDDNR